MGSSMQELLALMKAKAQNGPIIDTGKEPGVSVETKTVIQPSISMESFKIVEERLVEQDTHQSSSHTDGSATLPEAAQISKRIANLQESLQLSLPNYDSLLHTIHKQLSKDPELTQLLKPDEIGIIVAAMMKKKDIVLVSERQAKSGKKSLSKTNLDDIL